MFRIPLGYKPINPQIRNIFIDSCAFDPKYSPEDEASFKIFELYKNGKIILNIARSNLKEVDHPNTPAWVKKEASGMIYTIKTSLTNEEIELKLKIYTLLTGEKKSDYMKKDSEHIFEASKYGGYFVTTDKGILNKKEELESICSATIVKPSELLNIISLYENT